MCTKNQSCHSSIRIRIPNETCISSLTFWRHEAMVMPVVFVGACPANRTVPIGGLSHPGSFLGNFPAISSNLAPTSLPTLNVVNVGFLTSLVPPQFPPSGPTISSPLRLLYILISRHLSPCSVLSPSLSRTLLATSPRQQVRREPTTLLPLQLPASTPAFPLRASRLRFPSSRSDPLRPLNMPLPTQSLPVSKSDGKPCLHKNRPNCG